MSHLQRYKTELVATKRIALDLQAASQSIRNVQKENSTEETRLEPSMNMHLVMLTRQISALEAFANELEKKATTVLDLVYTLPS